MYAIIQTGGKQYWVTPGQKVKVGKLIAEEGQEIMLDAIWSAGENPGADVKVDVNALPKAKVTATVIKHLRDRKVLSFKKKPKTGYKKMIGERQYITEIKIEKIQLS